MYIDLHLQYMYVYHVRVYGSTKRWTSDLNKTFLAVASGVFCTGCDEALRDSAAG